MLKYPFHKNEILIFVKNLFVIEIIERKLNFNQK